MTATPSPSSAFPSSEPAATPSAVVHHPVFFDPTLASARLAAAKRARTTQIVWLFVSLAISGAIWFFLREQLGDNVWFFLGLSVAISLAQLAWAILRARWAKKDAARVGEGMAVGFGPDGIAAAGAWLPWSEVTGLAAVPATRRRSLTLLISPREGVPLDVPLDYVTVMPATLDAGVRAVTNGRRWIDFTALAI